MHIHGSIPGVQSAEFYGVSNRESAEAAKRAAETRKKLLRAGQNLDTETTPEESELVNQWLDARHSRVSTGDAYHATVTGRDSDLG